MYGSDLKPKFVYHFLFVATSAPSHSPPSLTFDAHPLPSLAQPKTPSPTTPKLKHPTGGLVLEAAFLDRVGEDLQEERADGVGGVAWGLSRLQSASVAVLPCPRLGLGRLVLPSQI